MISFSLPEYVEWLHVIENMDIWAAKEKAQAKYHKVTGIRLELHEIMSTSELAELRVIAAVMGANKKPKK